MNKNTKHHDPEALRNHSYDGIQEYDKKLPNWWLFTLYGAMVFAAGYWAYYEWTGHMLPGYESVEQKVAEFQKNMNANGAAPTDAKLCEMSNDPAVVASGEKIYVTNCLACHGADLKGGIGQNLVDATWLHGGTPTDIYNTVSTGVAAKGMPTWGPVLGASRVAEVVAFLISKNSTIERTAP
ncbi:MAG: c-type cytochrome [Chthoniobacterales bacterium]|jgi:cytochrome c oxidase cbb3-type subunit 3|nr:c-type cytochrome [Chthoniobacterales bacterium]